MSGPLTQIKCLGRSDYQETWDAMKDFTRRRDPETPDELWITEHAPIFTQGLNGRSEHLLDAADTPLVQVDRGGQITYHGPGQLVLYCLLDIARLNLGVKGLVARMENSVIDLLNEYQIVANTRPGAPGVYVDRAKIAALGLRIRKGCCYHGLSLNVEMDLEPFTRINPCGFQDLAVTQLREFGVTDSVAQVGYRLADILTGNLSEKKPGNTGR